jgi:hypothetical protein
MPDNGFSESDRAGTPELSLVAHVLFFLCSTGLGDLKERNHSEDLDADGRILERSYSKVG